MLHRGYTESLFPHALRTTTKFKVYGLEIQGSQGSRVQDLGF